MTGFQWHPDQTVRLGLPPRLTTQAISAGGTQSGARLPSNITLLAVPYCCKTRQGWFHGYQFAKDWEARRGGLAQPGITGWVWRTVPSASFPHAEWHRSPLPLTTNTVGLLISCKTSVQTAAPHCSALRTDYIYGRRMKGMVCGRTA